MKTFECKFKDLCIEEENNNRDFITSESCYTLAKSIKEKGLLTPVIVRTAKPEDGTDAKYVLMAGFRRCLAVKSLLKRKSIHAVLKEDIADFDANFTENLERKDLSIREQAAGVKKLMDEGVSLRQISERLHRSYPWVECRANYLKLPEDVKLLIDSGAIKLVEIKKLSRFRKNSEMIDYTQALIARREKQAKATISNRKDGRNRRRANARMLDYLSSRENYADLREPIITLLWVLGDLPTVKFFEEIGLSQEDSLDFEQG